MSTTLGFGLISILCFLLTFLIIWQLAKIVYGRVQELDVLIKTLSKEKKIEDELKLIKSYQITIEKRLIEIEKAVGLDNSNFND